MALTGARTCNREWLDPFPEKGLEIHGGAVGWYVKWFDEMFKGSCAVGIYECDKTNLAFALIDLTRSALQNKKAR